MRDDLIELIRSERRKLEKLQRMLDKVSEEKALKINERCGAIHRQIKIYQNRLYRS